MFKRHKHKWKVIEKIEQESIVESYRKAGMVIKGKGLWPDELDKITKKHYVVTYKCEECGTEKVDRV